MVEKSLELALAWLGLEQYHVRFVQAGFDSWETLLEITEHDFEVLDVALGHRRRLQKEIHQSRGKEVVQNGPATQRELDTPSEVPSYSPLDGVSPFTTKLESSAPDGKAPAKRSYRHHPKPDPNAPKRPYSAYVLFSNQIRDVLAPENLEFPEISREVGQRWQALSVEEKDSWKQQAQGPRDKYKEDMSRYQGTAEHLEHKRYVDRFQTKQTSKNTREDGIAVGSQISPSKRRSSVSYPTPGQMSARTDRTFSDYDESLTMLEAPRSGVNGAGPTGSPDQNLPSERPRRDSMKEATENGEKKARSKQACDTCRQKKTKCNEERPTCGRCLGLDIECHYSNSKENVEKRKFTELFNKLDTCQRLLVHIRPQLQDTEQALIQSALNMPPGLDTTKASANQTMSMDEQPRSPSNSECSDEDTPGPGLMSAAGHVNDDDSATAGMETRPRAFAGQSSDVQWMRRLTNELDGGDNERRLSNPEPAPMSAQSNIFAEDNETAAVGDNVDPFQVPIKSIADALVEGYFRTVHLSFPILHRSLFMQQYERLGLIWHKSFDFEDRIFMTLLQLVLAIGAVHARLSGAVEVSDDRDHMLYFARARILAVDSGIFNDQVHLGQAQVFGLGAMYCLVNDQTNRAWIASGLAIRSTQSLGLHLQNITPSVSKADKEYRSRIWFALLSFERTLGVMSGRPSMVQDFEYNLTLPPPESADSLPSSSQSGRSYTESSSSATDPSPRTQKSSPLDMIPNHDQSMIEATYFRYHLELSSLAHEAVSQLYSPTTRQYRWSKIQALIDDYDDRLAMWESNLEAPFGGLAHNFEADLGRSPLGVALAIQFNCLRAIVNRPCLYRRERKTFKQSSYTAVSRCIGSARAVINLVFHSPAIALIHQGPKWWLLLHHTKRSLTVILLELAFRAEHMPSEVDELLADAKKALAWLREMARTSKIAEHTWYTMSCLHVKAARRVGIDAGNDAFPGNRKEQLHDGPQNWNEDMQLPQPHAIPALADSYQPQDFNPAHLGAHRDMSAFGDYLPHDMDDVYSCHDPMAYQSLVGLEAFDQFSFEPMVTGQGDVSNSYALNQPDMVIDGEGQGQVSHPQPSLAVRQGLYSPSGVPQLQRHQQQRKNTSMGTDAYLTDDCFGFDPSRGS